MPHCESIEPFSYNRCVLWTMVRHLEMRGIVDKATAIKLMKFNASCIPAYRRMQVSVIPTCVARNGQPTELFVSTRAALFMRFCDRSGNFTAMASWMVVRCTMWPILYICKSHVLFTTMNHVLWSCADRVGETKDMALGGHILVTMKGVELERVHQ
jgi:hypothetical protein